MKSLQSVKGENDQTYFIKNIFPVLSNLQTKFTELTVPIHFQSLQCNTVNEDSICRLKNFELLRKTQKDIEIITKHTKVNNITDRYTPFLHELKKKYDTKKTVLDNQAKKYNTDRDVYYLEKGLYMKRISEAVQTLDAGIENFNYMDKYKLLDSKKELKDEYNKFMNDNYPRIIANETLEILNKFNGFLEYCTEDIFNNGCTKDSHAHGSELSKNFTVTLQQLKNENLLTLDEIDFNRLIFLLKNLKRHLTHIKEIVEIKEITNIFANLTEDYNMNINDMRNFLDSRVQLNITDFKDLNPEKKKNLFSLGQEINNVIQSINFTCLSKPEKLLRSNL